jgi:hypothetical protein
MASQRPWPALDYEACHETLTTLHLYTQIIGKVQLALMPMMSQWAQAPLRVTPRGLATQLLRTGDRALAIHLDLTGHELRFDVSDGGRRTVALGPRTVADFYGLMMQTLDELDASVEIDPMSVEMAEPVSLATDTTHSSYDRGCVEAYFQTLARVAPALDVYRGGFSGKQTPVDFWWGTFDLSVSRFSLRPAGPPIDGSAIEQVAMDAEQATVGFWPGDEHSPRPAFFAFTHPKPPRLETAQVRPAEARWSDDAGEFILPYEVVRTADDPRHTLLEFCEST